VVSKKLPGIRRVSIELEVSGKPTAEGAETLQQLLAPGLARDAKLTAAGDMDFDLIAFPELQGFDHGGGKADREAVSPFGDLHASLRWMYILTHVYQEAEVEVEVKGAVRAPTHVMAGLVPTGAGMTPMTSLAPGIQTER
jgi:hypothetical protein